METQHIVAPKQPLVCGWIGALLIRLFVPAWIIFGAYSKLQGATPKSLPRSILDGGGILGFQDHFFLLSILVAIEFGFIAFMLFSPKLARISAVSILGIFLAVLSIEMFVYGNFESCGCFGEKSLAPTSMFAIDLALLIGIVVFKPRKSKSSLNKNSHSVILITIFILLTWVYTFYTIMGNKPFDNGSTGEVTNNLPSSWYPRDISAWGGKDIDQIELFSWIKKLPENIHDGKQYIIFYSTSCDHCEALLYGHFEFPEYPTTLVAIPQSSEPVDYEGAFDISNFDCYKTELKAGPDWIVGTPLVVAIDNGIVNCATENEEYEAPACLIW